MKASQNLKDIYATSVQKKQKKHTSAKNASPYSVKIVENQKENYANYV